MAIFDSPDNVGDERHVRIICECKAPTLEIGITELKTYLSLEPEARLGIWFNGQKHRVVYKLPDGFVVSEYAPIPRPGDPLSPTAARPPKRFGDLRPPPSMGEIFWRLRDQIAAQDTRVNRDEFILNDLANLLVCKIADEQDGEVEPERPMAFQTAGNASATAHAIRAFFEDVKQKFPAVFTDETERLHIDDDSLAAVVKGLEEYQLLGHDRHAVGTAFQILRGRALKGEEGAYFTPAPVVDCVVQILAPDHRSRLIDPACGTGGFLAASLDYVFETVDRRSGVSREAKERTKRAWAQEQLYALDKDFVSTKLCKAYLTLLGDGRSHVFRANMIDRRDWQDRGLTRTVNDGSFDIVMTNPPFGSNLVVPEAVARDERLLTCRKWVEEREGEWEPSDKIVEQQLGIAFFERDLNLLKDGGHLAIVLPETFLFSKTFRWFVDWISKTCTITHVVDVPMVAFEEFCRAKTCLVFVRKTTPARGHKITFSYPRSIGQDKRGAPLHRLNENGERSGELDNEMADAAREIVGREYRGTARVGASSSDTRLCFQIGQTECQRRGVLVPRFWWRKDTQKALRTWCRKHTAQTESLGSLVDRGIISVFEGHGSPPGNARATGDVPYVKVTDLKNWRINENPTNFVHKEVADALKRRGVTLKFGDLISPARASSNIGQFSLVLPWQTNILLTKEVVVLRVNENREGITSFLMIALMSLKVVQDQYRNLVLMQTNREHLGDHWREVEVPFPTDNDERKRVGGAAKSFFDGIVKAQQSWATLAGTFDPAAFGTRP